VGKKSPKTPDVIGAAKEEGKQSRETARDQTYADRPDQYNTMGSNTWGQTMVQDPATGEMVTKWTQNQTLSPEMQNLYNTQMQTNQQLGSTAAAMGDRVNAEMGAPLNWEQFGDVEAGPQASGVIGAGIGPTTGPEGFEWDGQSRRQAAEDASYGRATSRLDPQMEQKRQELEVRLRNRGLRAGDQAYESEMAAYGRDSTDAYEQARFGSTLEGRAEDAQSYDQASNTFGQNLTSEQQRYNQMLSGGQNDREADQQAFNQEMSANERANALRQQQIQEYTGKRGFSLEEQQALQGAQTTGDMVENFSA
tara:strand:- start:5303 stop:6226 length:924 start_codon:yes stop_codon:yes gene_type:complete